MKKTFLICFLFALSTFTYAQVNLDSLWGVWNDENQEDTNRLKALEEIIESNYINSNPDSALYFAQLLHDLAEGKDKKQHMAKALLYKGFLMKKKGKYSEAMNYFTEALEFRKELNDKKGISYVLLNIGNIFFAQDDMMKALEYYIQSLEIQQDIKDKEGISSSLVSIGNIYAKMADYSNAEKYYTQSLQIAKESNDKISITIALGNIATLFINQEEYAKSIDYFNRSLKLFKELNNKTGVALTLTNLGYVYRMSGKYSAAHKYLSQSLEIQKEIKDSLYLAQTLINFGNLYRVQSKEKEAIKWCKEGLEIATNIQSLMNQRHACECLYKSYKSLGNRDEALEYHEQLVIIDDSLKEEETTKKLQQMEFQKQILADSLKKEEEKLKVQHAHELEIQKKNRTRNIYIASGILLVFLAVALISRLRYTRKSKAIIEKEKDRSENLLLNILPSEIAEELKEKGYADARDFDMVSILFTDFNEFTRTSSSLSAKELVAEINTCYEAFDQIIEKQGIEKIKTIGDSYMAAGGLPIPSNDSVVNTIKAAIEMQAFIIERKKENTAKGESCFEMRVGIHTGPVVAGIVGVKKFQYDVWGDTVNTASRMEQKSEVGKINISYDTYELIKDNPLFTFEYRGKIDVKGKGEMEMYYVSRSFSEC